MAKIVIRETIIALLVCLAVLLTLSVLLYNYIPTNKVVPETVEYKPSKEIQTQLTSTVDDSSDEIIMTYEITANDLANYERTNEYNPGKANPFAAVAEEPDDNESGNNTQGGSTNSGSSSNGSTSNGGSSNNNSGGSLFENGSSK